MKPKTDPELRFWPKVDKSSDCWICVGQIHKPTGYGIFWNGDTYQRAHRYRFVADNGYEPEVVMHSCDTPACVRPEHLTGGTQLDNIRDRDEKRRHWAQSRTHCKRGHPISEENTKFRSDGRRECRVCRRQTHKAWKGRK